MTEQQANWRRFRRMIPPPGAPVRVELDTLATAVLDVRDLSEDGMELQFSGLESVHVDDLLSLTMWLPLEAPIRATARIRHLTRSHVGVTFVDLEPRHQQAVRRYIQRFATRPPLWQRLRQLWLA
jgi:c-di-GMP-binding flagellar brake protein YcgR